MSDLNDRTQNVSIHDDTTDDAVTTTVDGSKRRLDVSTPNETNPTLYKLETDYDATGVTVTSTDTEIFSFTGAGIIDFIALAGSAATYEVIITVDGEEKIRITVADIGSNLGLSAIGGGNLPIWVETANKNFRFNPNSGLGFSSSFTIEARATGSNVNIAHLIIFRELST